jgi:exodeoxyribonuclease V alpha subunit
MKILSELLNKGTLSFVDLAFAQSVLKQLNSNEESHAALLATLFALSRLGHLALDISKPLPLEDSKTLLPLIHTALETFPNTPWVCRHHNHLYLQKNWECETEIFTHLHRLSAAPPTLALNTPTISPHLNAAQNQAVQNAIRHSLSLITGGPGTGKTFTAAQLIKSCSHLRIILAAPTGKAVAQLEANLKKAVGDIPHLRSGTLHAILNTTPLFADLILVDECSMIDSKIFARLLSSIQTGTRLILIGDKDQLPPVEAGSIFADILDANIYPSAKLTTCLRSDSKEILSLARSIKEGNSLEVITTLSPWIELNEDPLLLDRYKHKFPPPFLHPPTPEQLLPYLGKFTILSCMRQGPFGVDAINAHFLNQIPQGAWFAAPIIVTRNTPDLQLFNGDTGFLIRQNLPDLQPTDYILFPSRQVPALALTFDYAYCLSVHKSQGSEYDETLILIPTGSESFGREVLYTALTRAKTKATFAGSQSTLLQALSRTSRKSTGLLSRFAAFG